jgi:putative ABC transport system substrate-binding protein
MRRREFITLIGGAAAWPLVARAQQPATPFIGLLAAGTVPNWQFRSTEKGLNEGGYIEGRNLAIMYRLAGGE